MQNKYIELRINREFGDILSVYFDFLKQNIKNFTNVFLRYNGISLIGLLIVSYLLVSGFIGVFVYEGRNVYGGSSEILEEKYTAYIISGVALFLIIFLLTTALNYSLSSSYMIRYQENKGLNFEAREAWDMVKDNLGNILLFVLCLILLFTGVIVVSFILLLVPFLGIFAYYILLFFFLAWVGVSFFHMMQEKTGVMDAFKEGWNLVFDNFWKSIGTNFILGILNNLIQIVLDIIPFVIVGIYTFHAVESNIDFSESVVATIVYTLGVWFALAVGIYGYCLTQFVNGVLYYSLHEKKYNIYTRSKIEEIGKSSL
nr:hypothetical protein [Allomuricauda sp.]